MPPEAHEIARARRALFHAGHELSGRRLEVFAARLLALTEVKPDETPADLVASVLSGADESPVRIVAEEPELRELVLAFPARSVSEAAVLALEALGEQLVIGHRRRSPADTRESLLSNLHEQAHTLAELTSSATQSDDMRRLIAVRDQVFVIRETLATLGVPNSLTSNDTWKRHIEPGDSSLAAGAPDIGFTRVDDGHAGSVPVAPPELLSVRTCAPDASDGLAIESIEVYRSHIRVNWRSGGTLPWLPDDDDPQPHRYDAITLNDDCATDYRQSEGHATFADGMAHGFSLLVPGPPKSVSRVHVSTSREQHDIRLR